MVDEVEVVPLAVPAVGPLQVDAAVLVALGGDPVAQPHRGEQVDRERPARRSDVSTAPAIRPCEA